MSKKLVKLSVVRDAMDAHFRGEITYSKAVEIINESANKELNNKKDDNETDTNRNNLNPQF